MTSISSVITRQIPFDCAQGRLLVAALSQNDAILH